MFTKVHAAQTNHEEGEAEYDAHDFPFQIVDYADGIIALFSNEKERDHVLALLQANPFPE